MSNQLLLSAFIGISLLTSACGEPSLEQPQQVTSASPAPSAPASKATTVPPELSSSPSPSQALIPYKVLNTDTVPTARISFDVEVPLVENRLPNESELGAISQQLASGRDSFDSIFVGFYLPGMEVGMGAYATAHHTPTMEVVIQTFMLQGNPTYEKYLK